MSCQPGTEYFSFISTDAVTSFIIKSHYATRPGARAYFAEPGAYALFKTKRTGNHKYRIKYRTLEEAQAGEGPWSLSFMSFRLNPSVQHT